MYFKIIVFTFSVILFSVQSLEVFVYEAEFQPGSMPDVAGQLTFSTLNYSGVSIKGQITGLTPGLHGFHIHEIGDLGNACKNAGGHFNPFKRSHGGPNDTDRHVGDLGNIEADHLGVANVDVYDEQISLEPSSPAFIGERTVDVHENTDDLGRGANLKSKKDGNAGPRAGCGLIKPRKLLKREYPKVPSTDFSNAKSSTNSLKLTLFALSPLSFAWVVVVRHILY